MKLLESREHVRTEVNTASVGSDNETRDTLFFFQLRCFCSLSSQSTATHQISAGERRASKNHLKALITTLEKGLSSSVCSRQARSADLNLKKNSLTSLTSLIRHIGTLFVPLGIPWTAIILAPSVSRSTSQCRSAKCSPKLVREVNRGSIETHGQLGYIFIRRETETIAMGYAHSCPNNRMHGTHCT